MNLLTHWHSGYDFVILNFIAIMLLYFFVGENGN